MESHMATGFVLADTVTFTPYSNAGIIVLSGTITCLGGIVITVEKTLDVLSGTGANAFVQHNFFNYHAHLAGGPSIFRYDSPCEHRDYYHKHIFDTFGSGEQRIERIENVEAVPTLGKVIAELDGWYWTNRERIGQWAGTAR